MVVWAEGLPIMRKLLGEVGDRRRLRVDVVVARDQMDAVRREVGRGTPQAGQWWYINRFPYLSRSGWLIYGQTGPVGAMVGGCIEKC